MVGHIFDGGTADGIAVSGNYAFLASGRDGLRIYDISDPTSPKNIAHTNVAGGSLSGIAVRDSYAYLTGNPGLAIFDISNPAKPLPVSASYPTVIGMAVCLSGNLAIISGGYQGIFLCDVSSPATIAPLGHLVVNLSAFATAVKGSTALVAAKDGGLRIVDISDPTQLKEIASKRTASGYYTGVAVNDHFVYLANSLDGLLTYDISNLQQPVDLSPFPSGGGASVTISGNYAYLAKGSAGLAIFDISAPGTLETAYPANQTKTNFNGVANSVAISRDYAYVANGNDGLRIYSLGTPTAPRLAVTISTEGEIQFAWPAPTAAFAVQQSADLSTANWSMLTNEIRTVDSQNSVAVTPPQNAVFYRLVGL